MPEDEALRALVSRVQAFHVTDRAMLRAQRCIETALAAGDADWRDWRAYLHAVRKYFSAFEREAQTHLRSLDRRLERANQIHFNLTAERGVAVRRIEATRAVLQELERVSGPQGS